jgi:hypothetical protein
MRWSAPALCAASAPEPLLILARQEFAERLLALLRKCVSSLSYDHKLLMLELISRVMAVHRLVIHDFYEFVLRYLTPHQVPSEHA